MTAKLQQASGASTPVLSYHAEQPYHTEQPAPALLYDRLLCKTCSINRICPQGRDGLGMSAGYEQGIVRPLQKGEYLFRQGDRLTSIHIIRAGGVKLLHTSYDGMEQILNFYLKGEVLSLGDVETGIHTTAAIALETTSVCKVPYDRVQAACREEPRLYDLLFRLASREIANEHAKMLLLGQKQSEERFASFILDMAGRSRRNGYSPREFNLTMSRHDIAIYLCLADETVSRLITKFCNDEVLKVDRRSIRINDPERLSRKAGADAAAYEAYLN